MKDKRIAVVIIFVLSAYFINWFVQSGKDKQTERVNASLKEAASQISTILPQMLDSHTQLDAVFGGDGKFTYKNSLVNLTADQVNAEDLRTSIESNIRKSICTTPQMQPFRQDKIVVEYMYYGKNGGHILTLTVPTSDCVKTETAIQ